MRTVALICVTTLAAVGLVACTMQPASLPASSQTPSPTPFTVTDGTEWTEALESGDMETLVTLIEESGPMAVIDDRTALHIASQAGNADAVAALVDAGADLNERDERRNDKWTALHFAAEANCAPCIETLLAAGADPLIPDRVFPSRGPIHVAASVGALDALVALLAGGVDVDALDGAGGHALLWAAYNGQTEAAVYLLEQGADPTLVDGSQNNASQRAAGQGHTELAALLARAIEDWEATP